MKLGLIAVPYFVSDLHRTWAEETMQSVVTRHQLLRIAIVNRLGNEIADRAFLSRCFDEVYDNDRNCLARAWNIGIERAFSGGARFVLVMNLDLLFHPQCIDALVDFAEAHPEGLMWCATRWAERHTLLRAVLEDRFEYGINGNCFLIDQRLFEEVGRFDEQFEPAYLEDSDMAYRIKLHGAPILISLRALFFHLEAATMKGCLDGPAETTAERLEIMRHVRQSVAVNDARYCAKWGGLPSHERFRTPYGRAEG